MTTEKKWYVVHTYSGYEEKVKLGIEDKVQKKGIEHRIGRILIPTERVIELKRGKKKESDKKFYPGYIMVEMELDDETWHLVNSVPRVTGFVGGMAPVSLPEEEMDLILQQQEKSLGQEVKMQFEKGENLRITDGPFSNFNGYVDEVDIDHGRLKVMVSIFGRQTPVELSFYQVEKV
ncbi:MAG: transcription termination/antitermination protein NusG [Candidatus Magnetobacterium sp. LHC-1]|uniref:Transcription termination/antitermination protein NusG n=1 Tax=Candidatus Magnetobacterium casense TaxID=1455061 RepID=A0ABS6RXW7_9BACT|nr:transcription termination/antitermination protein NusG [Candidatus Magnetobacterium casensis]MBF0607737.1 transcription termination/antitermination protein NusG [Nitrospirota bacterium]MBV6340653.1 transcription termination/antitermination protein NusG [Candidatus Magnetobacterium casensis]